MNYLQNVLVPKTVVESNASSWASIVIQGILDYLQAISCSQCRSRTPCGFCFVEYYTHAEALACMRYVSGTKLDERIIRCDLDQGYKEGRQFGRGKSGGQVRDEHRQDYDPGRGGWGAQAQRQEVERRKQIEERYADAHEGPGAVALGGGEWKEADVNSHENKLKRDRSPEEDLDEQRAVGVVLLAVMILTIHRLTGYVWMMILKRNECSILDSDEQFRYSTQ